MSTTIKKSGYMSMARMAETRGSSDQTRHEVANLGTSVGFFLMRQHHHHVLQISRSFLTHQLSSKSTLSLCLIKKQH